MEIFLIVSWVQNKQENLTKFLTQAKQGKLFLWVIFSDNLSPY